MQRKDEGGSERGEGDREGRNRGRREDVGAKVPIAYAQFIWMILRQDQNYIYISLYIYIYIIAVMRLP